MVAALSLALDLGLGQPMEHMLRAAMIATRLADRIGLDATERGVVFYAELVSWIGCQADSPELTALFADEIAFRAGTFPVDLRGLGRARFLLGQAGHGRPLVDRGRATVRMLADGHGQMQELLASHYASAGALADRLGMGVGVRDAIHHTFERWDGTGLPAESAARPSRSDAGRARCRRHGGPPARPGAGRRGGDGPSTQRHPVRSAGRGRAGPDVRRDLRRTGREDVWPAALSRRPTRIDPCPIPRWMIC